MSRRLKHIPKKKSSQKTFDFCLMVLSEMLEVGPWCRLPLTVRWLDYEFSRDYHGVISPPLHMPICYGKVTSRKVKQSQRTEDNVLSQEPHFPVGKLCFLCAAAITEMDSIACIKPKCILTAHLICLAKAFCKDGMILPIEGTCPICKTNVLWGDLIRKKNGCYQNLRETNTDSASSNSDTS